VLVVAAAVDGELVDEVMFVEDQDVVVGVEAADLLAGVFDAESDDDSANSDRAVAGRGMGG
jgi:hypothetical protein